MKSAIVIGAGLGGMSAALRLAKAGVKVKVLEQQPQVGGKLQRIVENGYLFDRGPSTITMPEAFERVFQSVGKRMEDYMELYRLEEGTRNYFSDGNIVDFSADPTAMEQQIGSYSTHDASQYRAFLKQSSSLYYLAQEQFMNRLLLDWKDKLSLRMLKALIKVRPLTTLNTLLKEHFTHPNTLSMFGRFATYVGSAPAQAPAIFAMLPYLEASLGVYGVKGGTYSIVAAMRRLGEELGVEYFTSARVSKICTHNGKVSGVETNVGDFSTDLVIANGDLISVCRDLLDTKDRPSMTNRKINSYEPSLSGLSILIGIKKKFSLLKHHTVFFPEHYSDEFHSIFNRLEPAIQPAIYICNSSYSEPVLAPEGASNLFVLVNAPYTSNKFNWTDKKADYCNHILNRLETLGISGLHDAEVLMSYSPEQLEADTSAYKGAIYGVSSNSARQTFMRPSNRGDVKGLWFVGGTTHPGGGTPLVTTSGQLVAEAILNTK